MATNDIAIETNSDTRRNIGKVEVYAYFFCNLILFIILYFVGIKLSYDSYQVSFVSTLAFLVYLFLSLYFVTRNEYICGPDGDLNLAFSSSIIPFSLIYIAGTLCLQLFPGWIRGFANTYGNILANSFGYSSYVSENEILASNTGTNEATKTLLSKITTDPTLLLNELTLDGYDVSGDEIRWIEFDKMKGSGFINDVDNTVKKGLASFIYMKNMVSYFMWYTILGMLTLLISINNILNSNTCASKTKPEMDFKSYLQTNA
jgi:hypothetical protein